MKEQVGPKSFVFRFSSGTSPETILDNLMDEVLVLEEGLPKHGWRLLDTVVDVTWKLDISDDPAIGAWTKVDTAFKKLYVIESDCLDGSVKRAIFGATEESILMLGLTQWDSETKTSSDIKSLGYCSFYPSEIFLGEGAVYIPMVLWGIKFKLSDQNDCEKCTVALFIDQKWCAISKVSISFGITDMKFLNPGSIYPWNTISNWGLIQHEAIKDMRIQGLIGIFEHRNVNITKSSHSYINSALLGCVCTVLNWGLTIPNFGQGILLPDVPTFSNNAATYTFNHTKTDAVALPATNTIIQNDQYIYDKPKNCMARAVRTNFNPFTNTPNTDRLWLHEANPPNFRGEVFGLRCTLLETASWMDKVNVIGDDRLTPESYFVIPSGLVGKSSNPDFTFLNNFDLLIES